MSATAKNWLIALLLLTTLGQAWLLKDRYLPSPEQGLSLAAVTLDSGQRTVVNVEFTQPAPENARQADNPATITPAVDGKWLWTNPYTLKFLAQSPLPLDMEYSLQLDPALFPPDLIQGEPKAAFRTGSFEIQEFLMNELASEAGADMIEIEGRIIFNAPVDPEKLLAALSLTDDKGQSTELALQTTWRSTNFGFRSQPIRKDPTPRTLTLHVARTLTVADKTLSLGTDFRREIKVHLDPVLRVANVVPVADKGQTRIDLEFSAPVSAGKVRPHLRLSPAGEITLSSRGKMLSISGKLQPGTSYTLSLSQGVQADDGAVLDKEFTQTVPIPDLPPSVDFAANGMFLPRQGQGLLGLELINTDSVELLVSRVFPNNLGTLFQDYGYSIFDGGYAADSVPYHLGSEIHRQTYQVSTAPNTVTTRTVAMSDLIPDQRPGLYKLGLSLPGDYRGSVRWVLRTDIGLVVKQDDLGFVIWANSIESLAALPKVRVELRSDKNQILGRAETNDQGLARIPLQGFDYELGSPAMIQATRGDDFSFIFLDRFSIDTTGLDVSGMTISQAGLQAYVYGQRDIYRPGETLEAAVLVRDERLGTPRPMPLILEQTDPQGRILRTINLELIDGMAAFSLDIPDWSLTGAYGLSVTTAGQVIGSYVYQVEEFIPDRINVAISDVPDLAGPGQQIPFAVSSRYLFGPPAAGLPVTVKSRLLAKGFAPKGFEAYAFGVSGLTFEPLSLLTTDGVLDANGTQSFILDLPDDLRPPLALEAEITARVREQGGRGVTALERVPVHVHPFYPGIKRPISLEFSSGQAAEFEFVTVSPRGDAVPHPELTATLLRDEWQTVVRRTETGFRYESVRNPVEVSTATVQAGNAHGRFSVVPPDYGSYRVRLSDPSSGAAGEVEFYCGGWGYSPWAVQNPARLDLIPDKNGYRAGDIASVQIRSPFPGKALVAVEGREVEYLDVIELEGNTGQIRIPIKESWQPNRHLTVTLVRPGQSIAPASPGRAFGAIPLFVDSLSNKMTLDVDAPSEVRPETDLTVTVQARPGAKVTVAVVDEGIMQLAGGKNPDPFGHFYAKRALEVTSFDNFALLFPHLSVGIPLAGGDEALAGMFMRTEGIRRVRPVTFWSGVLTADDMGRLTYTVPLPDFQGALRIVAVASRDKSFGAATAMTRVRAPLVLTPTLPRFLAMNDEVLIPLTLRNDTPTAGSFTLSADVEGPARFGPLPEQIDVPAGTEATVHLPLTCGAAEGRVSLRFTATGNGETITVREEVDQRSFLPVQRTVRSGLLKEQTGILDEALSDSLMPETVHRTVRLSTLPVMQFAGHLENLLGYPHGCAEQTVSRAFPLIHFATLAKELAPGRFTRTGPAGLVQTAIRRLQTMQTPGGGFGYWPGSPDPDPWVSAYALHFLLEAQAAGHHTPAAMLQTGLAYLRSLEAPRPGSQGPQIEQSAYALYVLALGGRPDLGGQDFVRTTFAPVMNGLTRTLLAGAYFLTGHSDQGFELLRPEPTFDDQRRDSGGNLGSGLRDRALTLLILLAASEDDPRLADLTTRISQDLSRDTWYSTQETSLAFMALGKYLAGHQDDRPFTGTLTWPEGEEFLAEGKTFVLPAIPTLGAISLSRTPADRNVFYSVLTSGTPTAESHRPYSQGLEIEQVLLTRDGQPLDPDQIRQGDLLILKTRVRSTSGAVDNVVVQSLLPAGLEVENPRLSTTEKLQWMDDTDMMDGHQDLRDDRVLVFTDLRGTGWKVRYSLLRAVTPGRFHLPPAQVEAMYNPNLRAMGELGSIRVVIDTPTP